MRILIDYRPALRQRTGVGEYVHGLAASLVTRLPPADSLTLFSSSWKDRLRPQSVEGAAQVDSRIPVRLLNLAWHRLEWPPVDWLAGHVDVAHSMHPLMIPARGARVVTIHDLYFLNGHAATPQIRRDYPDLTESHARRADGIVVPSEYTKVQVTSRLGVDPAKVTVCSPGAPAWSRREEPAIPGPILFVGTIERRKNVPGLVRAYAELIGRRPDAPDLVLAGRMLDASEAGLSSASSAAGRVRALGYVTDAQRQQLYREASMLVMPSFDEGFGIPALEAMTVGVPVVAARRGALPEVIGDAGILVDPEDAAALSAAMERVLTEPHSRRRMADAGVSRARQFSWAASAVRLREAYDAAVVRRRLA